MARSKLILDRYEPLGTAGVGGFGTVQIAWDPRIQRKVAIKTIHLTELDAYRAKLPGARAAEGPAPVSAAERWHGVLPWEDEPNTHEPAGSPGSSADGRAIAGPREDAIAPMGESATTHSRLAPANGNPAENPLGGTNPHQGESAATHPDAGGAAGADPYGRPIANAADREPADAGTDDRPTPIEPVTSLAHLPGLDEARTAAMLDDPRIVTVFDFEVRDRTAYLIMEYVEGITLTRLLADYSDEITLDMVTAVFNAVAGALMTAHKAGVLHLDIKPDNIIITPQGQVKVTDFGLATLADASGAGTTGGGTIGYMPLEQMRREHLDARTDEWSLASLTYEMLTGANPFKAATLDEAERAIENAELVLPSLCWQDVDEQIDDVVFYALDPEREERYASVSDFAEEMDKFLGDTAQGEQDLADAVSRALGLVEEEAEEDQYADLDDIGEKRPSAGGAVLRSMFSGLFADSGSARDRELDAEDYDDGDFEDDYGDEPWEGGAEPRERGRGRKRKPHVPLATRSGDRATVVLARLFAIASSAALAFLATVNMPFLELLGPGQPIVMTVLVAACAIAAIVRPHIGALASYVLLGVSFAACGHPIAGAVLGIAVATWWYSVGHEGMAAANVALFAPVAGAIGAASAVPIVSGAACKPVPAIATTALAGMAAIMLAALGAGSLLGWDAFSNWKYASADMSANLVSLIARPATWTTVAGWMGASAALSLLRQRGSRALSIAGLAAGVALVLAGSLVFAEATPQLVISVTAAAAAILAILL